MEDLGMIRGIFGDEYLKKRVLVTGHTGFKGSWLALWLHKMGATVLGLSDSMLTEPSHFHAIQPKHESVIGDIRDLSFVRSTVKFFQPEIVFHLAAQSLVIESFVDPITTFETNILGTANVLQTCLEAKSVRGIVNITSDKCYKNTESKRDFREDDTLGGKDPYSCSKACSELLTDCYRSLAASGETTFLSARAGNVIGGGDWAKHRLFPDLVRAKYQQAKLSIRNPRAIRPWQHVLDPLSGYLLLGMHALKKDRTIHGSWNFGPQKDSGIEVQQLVELFGLNPAGHNSSPAFSGISESKYLFLNSEKALNELGWRPVWHLKKAVEKTMEWYEDYYISGQVNSEKQLGSYLEDALLQKSVWV